MRQLRLVASLWSPSHGASFCVFHNLRGHTDGRACFLFLVLDVARKYLFQHLFVFLFSFHALLGHRLAYGSDQLLFKHGTESKDVIFYCKFAFGHLYNLINLLAHSYSSCSSYGIGFVTQTFSWPPRAGCYRARQTILAAVSTMHFLLHIFYLFHALSSASVKACELLSQILLCFLAFIAEVYFIELHLGPLLLCFKLYF